jgi:AraC family transcriptional activator of pobA
VITATLRPPRVGLTPGRRWVTDLAPGRSRAAAGLAERRLAARGPFLDLARITSEPDSDDSCLLESRQDFHTLYWARSGSGRQFIDGVPFVVDAPMLTLVGRGQVYRFEHAVPIDGAVISFNDDLLYEGAATTVNPVWLIGHYDAQSVRVPPEAVTRISGLIDLLEAEARRPPDAATWEVHRHLLLALLLWVERLYDAALSAEPGRDEADLRLHHRFVTLLERDFAHHHDVGHYAAELGVPTQALARALSNSTGRPTKALIIDRLLLEASRLLRFSDLQIGEITSKLGLGSQFHFSRMFKQRYGESPLSFRARMRDGSQ